MNVDRPHDPSREQPILFVDAEPFSWKWFAGIPRYTARVVMALARTGETRFFDGDRELIPPPDLTFSQDQDLETWAQRLWKGERIPLRVPERPSIGLYCSVRSEMRRFPFEVSVVYDFCPSLVSWTLPDDARWGFEKFFSEDLPRSDAALAISHSTKADAAWLSPMPPERIHVRHPGPSLCVERHQFRGEVERSPNIGLAVSTVEPRKNARFLIDWFHKTDALPRDEELWWVGKVGWMVTPEELTEMSKPAGGRHVRFLGNIPDAELCRLYQTASWSIYPSLYEGFGFPVLDSLRHGTPVLTSMNSSLREFNHEGVYFFDPYDPGTLDEAWNRFREAGPAVVSRKQLQERYDWDLVAATIRAMPDRAVQVDDAASHKAA